MNRKTTEELLADSFLELAQTKRIDKITITEITNNCGMSQPTFYNHFKDKYDLKDTFKGAMELNCVVIITPERLIHASPNELNKEEIEI